MASNTTDFFRTLNDLVNEVSEVKRAASDDPGSSHPSARTEDGLVPLNEGEHSKEVNRILSDQVVGAVDGSSVAIPSQSVLQSNIGIEQGVAGESTSADDDYKAHPYDPGTAHPMRADSGEKYSSMSIAQLRSHTQKLGHAILSTLAVGASVSGKSTPAAQPAPVAAPVKMAATAADPRASADEVLGYKAAAALGIVGLDMASCKEAAIAGSIADGHRMGDLTANFLIQRMKAAEDEMAEQEEAPPESSMASGTPAMAMPGVDAPEGMGAEMGGMPMGAEGAPAEAGMMPSPEEAIQQLIAAAIEMGISPEELAAAAAQATASGNPEKQATINEVDRLIRTGRRSPDFTFEKVKTAREKSLRKQYKAFLLELVS